MVRTVAGLFKPRQVLEEAVLCWVNRSERGQMAGGQIRNVMTAGRVLWE